MEQNVQGIHAFKMDSVDALDTVKEKLTVIADFVGLCETVEMHHHSASIHLDTYPGIYKILKDCISSIDSAIPALKVG
jgi:hypothetical protein